MKKLIVYFSRVGENSVNGRIEVIEKGYTEILAEKIAKMTDAELWKLEPEEAYPFNYEECVKRANSEGWVKYLNKKDNLDEYDVIFLGFPNWWRTYPRIIATFIKDHNFFGKTVSNPPQKVRLLKLDLLVEDMKPIKRIKLSRNG